MTTPDTTTPADALSPPPGPGKRSSFRPFAIGLVIGALAGLGLYLTARYDWQSRLDLQQAQAQSEKDSLFGDLTRTRQAHKLDQARLALLDTRVRLAQALGELDRRNFGLANDHMLAAAAVAKRIDAEALGLNASQVIALSQAVQEAHIEVAEDMEAQRTRIIELTQHYDRLIAQAREKPAAASPSPAPAP